MLKMHLPLRTHLVEPYVVTEMGIEIEFIISTVSSSSSFGIATEDVNDSVLDLFCYRNQIHVISTARRTFDLSKWLDGVILG